jgi:hypothetical protein
MPVNNLGGFDVELMLDRGCSSVTDLVRRSDESS